MDIDSVDCSDPQSLSNAADAMIWFHSIDLGHGVVTKGWKTPALLTRELQALQLPDLRGKTVLDIGAYDGFYSFEAERRGATRVVSMDLHVWQVETRFTASYLAQCAAEGTVPTPPYRTEWMEWSMDPARMPGKARFDLARRALRSRVEPLVQDFMTANPAVVGTFDVVLFLGVLYHTQYPLAALQKVYSLTKDMAIIETEAMEIPAAPDMALCEFFPTNELNGDYSNWWSPNLRALRGLLRAAGFQKIEVLQGPPPTASLKPGDSPIRYRAIVHAFK